MARVFYHFEFFLVCCFVGTSRSRTVLPPQNLTLDFINTHPRVSWDPSPDFVEGCMYSVNFLGKQQEKYGKSNYAKSPHIGEGIMMNKGFLNVSVQTVCGILKSQEVFVTNNDPELVTNLDCAIISLSLTRCSWKPTVDAPPDLSFFYYLSNAKSPNLGPLPPLHECPSYINTNGVRTGCELKVATDQSLNMLFNGTVNRRVVRNTYKIFLVSVRPPPLNWTVNKTKDKFHISWTPPHFPNFTWNYMIKYSGCDQNVSITLEKDGNSASLNRVSSCPYRIAMRANAEGRGETEWTAFKHFDADKEQNLMLLPIILIPLTLAVLAVLTLLCCVKNKKRIFPEIPQPRNYLIDILDNNNKIGVHDVYFPTKEEECHITLVIDPQLNKPQV